MRMIKSPFENLLRTLQPVLDRSTISGLLDWDKYTICPDKAKPHRVRVGALTEAECHRAFISRRVRRAIKLAMRDVANMNDVERRIVQGVNQSYRRAVRLPVSFVQEISEASAKAELAWTDAKSAGDFNLAIPTFQRVIDLTGKKARLLGAHNDDPASVYRELVEDYEPGLSVQEMQKLLGHVRNRLVPFIQELDVSQQIPGHPLLTAEYPVTTQLHLSRKLLTSMGFDFSAGVLALSDHPFCMSLGAGDCRLTIERKPIGFMGIYSALHEGGHALLAQGQRQPMLASGLISTSLGVDESQSRMWENIVGRSSPFCTYLHRQLREVWPGFHSVTPNDFYRLMNRVSRSEIRIDADELTYNLHIILRVEMEMELFSGALPLAAAAARWADLQEQYVGKRPSNDAYGILQDDHWPAGMFGYFGTYTLGNLLSAQLFQAFSETHPDWEIEFASGNFNNLTNWLTRYVFPYGYLMNVHQLAQQVTGRPLSHEPWCQYVEQKYGALCGHIQKV